MELSSRNTFPKGISEVFVTQLTKTAQDPVSFLRNWLQSLQVCVATFAPFYNVTPVFYSSPPDCTFHHYRCDWARATQFLGKLSVLKLYSFFLVSWFVAAGPISFSCHDSHFLIDAATVAKPQGCTVLFNELHSHQSNVMVDA